MPPSSPNCFDLGGLIAHTAAAHRDIRTALERLTDDG
jgi:hypothetical protein